jgi:hypothetical protein
MAALFGSDEGRATIEKNGTKAPCAVIEFAHPTRSASIRDLLDARSRGDLDRAPAAPSVEILVDEPSLSSNRLQPSLTT